MALIRLATLSDLSDIMKIIREVVPIMNSSGNYQWDLHYPLETDFIADINSNCLYVYVNECRDICGFAALTTDQSIEYKNVGWDLEIPAIVVHRLAVSPNSQGRGIAKALLIKAEDLSKELNYNRVRIDTNSLNKSMQITLEKLEYVYWGDTKLNCKDPSMNFRCYEKIL